MNNAKQAIKENWSLTIPAWCKTLGLSKKEMQNLQKYHADCTDNLGKRVGQPCGFGKRPYYLLNYEQFLILQKYRATRTIRTGRKVGSKDSVKRKITGYLGMKNAKKS